MCVSNINEGMLIKAYLGARRPILKLRMAAFELSEDHKHELLSDRDATTQ